MAILWKFLFPLVIFVVIVPISASDLETDEIVQNADFIGDRQFLQDFNVDQIEERSARRSRNTDHQKGKASKKKDYGKRRLSVTTVQNLVSEILQKELQPLNTALKMVKLDTFSDGVLRQLSTLENIQSKLLTEYGEIRSAINTVSRYTLDLTKQFSALEEKVNSLDRNFNHRSDTGSVRSDFSGVTPGDMVRLTEVVTDSVSRISTRLTATERRFKDDIKSLENRTGEALLKTNQNFDRYLTSAGVDNALILNSLEKLLNKSCPSSTISTTGRSNSINVKDPFSRQSKRPLSKPNKFQSKHQDAPVVEPREEFYYFPAENIDKSSIRTVTRDQSVSSVPLVRPVNEIGTINLGMVSKLANEIAQQMAEDKTESIETGNCQEVGNAGEFVSGVYTIHPASCTRRYSVQVWCDLSDKEGGWTVIQRRGSRDSSPPRPVIDFFRDWAEYKWGFGNLEGEYWLGNEYIHQITQSGDYDLKIELMDWSNESRWATFKHFYLEDEQHNYTLHIGDYKGTAGNSLKPHDGAGFSTKDRDNDSNPRGHCARTFHGAWWFTACHDSHLNGRYHQGRHKSYGDGVNWMAFRGHNYSLKFARMMIRPAKSSP